MLGTSLALVGITLIINGLVALNGWNKKSMVLINLLTGAIIIFFNTYLLATSTLPTNDIRYFGGLLFGFTNIFVGIFAWFNLDDKVFGWFCFFGAICACFIGVFFIVTGRYLAGVMWLIWLTIWLFAFIGYAVNSSFIKFANLMFIIQGITTTLCFGLLLLIDAVKLY